MSAEPWTEPSLSLTGHAVGLLDVPFEPASAGGGEIFDRIIEHISDELSRAAASGPKTFDGQPHAIELPLPDSHLRRREQMLLRRSVLEGHHPAVPASLRASSQQLAEIVNALTHSLRGLPEGAVPTVSLAATTLASLIRSIDHYRRSAIRLQRACSSQEADLQHQADLAARAERTLVRELRQIAETTYGRAEVSRCEGTTEGR